MDYKKFKLRIKIFLLNLLLMITFYQIYLLEVNFLLKLVLFGLILCITILNTLYFIYVLQNN